MTSALPWLTALSALLTILAAPFAWDQAWMPFVFKPLTTILILAHAWPRGGDAPKMRRLIRAGLVLSLVGDVFLLWPKEGFVFGLVAFLLAHLAYIAAFSTPLRFGARRWPFAAYAIVAALILGLLWPGVPGALRLPVLAYVLCLASMAAQAAAWWLSGHGDAALARNAALGGLLFMASDALLAVNKFSAPLPLATLWILATYWSAQWCIAESLRGPGRGLSKGLK